MRTPAPDWLILLARFAAQMLLALGIVIAGILGYELSCRMPWIGRGLAGPLPWRAWTSAFVVLTVPTIAAVSALAMCLAAATQNRFAHAILPLGIWMLTPLAFLATTKGLPTLGFLVEPLGLAAVTKATLTLPPAEQLSWRVTLKGELLWNRLIWLTVAAMSLALASALVTRRAGSVWFPALSPLWKRSAPLADAAQARVDPRRPAAAPFPAPAVLRLRVVSGSLSALAIYWARTRFELAGIVRSLPTLVFIMLPVLAAFPVLIFGGTSEADNDTLLPVSAIIVPKLAEAVAAGAGLFAVIFAGEMMWRERQAAMHEIVEAAGVPPLAVLAGKLMALALVIALQYLVVSIIGIVWQATHGAPQINISHYAARLFLAEWTTSLMVAAFAMFVHAVVSYRIAAHLISLGLLILFGSFDQLGIEHSLLIFGNVPKIELSDMNGLGHYVAPALWFVTYWVLISAVLFLLADLIRDRGLNAPVLDRLRAVRTAPRVARQALTLLVVGAAIVGSAIFWNTNIRNSYASTSSIERQDVAYERAFGTSVVQAQPRVAALDLALDIYPAQRAFRVKGEMTLRNPTAEPIARFYIEAKSANFKLSVPEVTAVSVPRPDCCRVFEVKLKSPMAPGQELKLAFEDEQQSRGKLNGDDFGVHENGTRLDAYDVAPMIGVHRRRFLQSDARREKWGLPRLKDATGGDGSANQALFSPDSDSMFFSVTVSTSADQTAVAPGKLARRWQADGRAYFRYEIGVPADSTWTITSARYVTVEDSWNGIPLYVHHHSPHAGNVGQMFEGMKRALDYCSEAFSPYQFQELRLAEYPYSDAIAATSQPGFIAYSETAGFIIDTTSPGSDRAKIAHVTSHEVAHQWWGYQIAPANRPGGRFLAEALAEYTAIMILRKHKGAAASRTLITAGLERYLKARKDASEEQPLAMLDLSAPPGVFYQKGSAALYALMEEVGEASMNRALARFVKEKGGKHDPYPSAQDLVATLKEDLGPRHHALITDLFERITFWSFKARSAKAAAQRDGTWRTTLTLDTKKLEADSKGAEREDPLDQRVPISVYTSDPGNTPGKGFETVRVALRSGRQTVSFVTKTEPKFLRINPSRALMQRDLSTTTIAVAR